MNNPTSFESKIRTQVKSTGPITVAEFITQVLYDPREGYYNTKIPIGREGDYLTAPEMTQVFGEVIAGWLIDVWQNAGSPKPFHFAELGPGRGTLMADMLRTFKSLNIPFPSIHLVEISPLLKAQQQATLAPFSIPITWHTEITTLPTDQGFCLMVANEFWDALPIHQQVNIEGNWVERRIGLEGDQLVFIPQNFDAIRESCPAIPAIVEQISNHLKINGGAALFIDYGYDEPKSLGETLQALYRHQKVSPLEHIGLADLTHHVDFHQLKILFQEAGMIVQGPTSQGDFLQSIGFMERTDQLCTHATPEQSSTLKTAAIRLTHPSQMGALFKMIAVTELNITHA